MAKNNTIVKPLIILVGLVSVLFFGMIVTGNFQVDNTGPLAPFGVYDNNYEPAAHYNYLYETLAFLEVISLVLLVIILAIGRRSQWFHNVGVAPWLTVIVGILFALFVWPMHFGYGSDSFDWMVSSELPTLLEMQVPIIVSWLVGFWMSYRAITPHPSDDDSRTLPSTPKQ